MSRTEPAEFTVMCMVEDGRGNVLVQDRADKNWPGIVFPGGHVEPRESFVRAVVREMYEETGLTVENPVLCGVKQFQDGRRYVVLLYRASRFTGVLRSSDEGRVFWTPLAELPQALGALFTPLSAVSFLLFTLLYTPCVAAIATVKLELRSTWQTVGVVALQCTVAWIVATLVFQVGSLL